ncbi:vitronectin-like [Arapaima gigas]
MKLLGVSLLAMLAFTFAAEESCMDRCDDGFNASLKCQCDSMCRYYNSCCSDYDSMCKTKTRGDTFAFPEDSEEDLSTFTTGPRITPFVKPNLVAAQGRTVLSSPSQTSPVDSHFQTTPVLSTTTLAPTSLTTATTPITKPTIIPTTGVLVPGPDPCSKKPFDSFLQLKNGSIYAFQGEYFFELGDKDGKPGKTVLPGYPKHIEDVWGIPGPVDAAFTRINCQGKTYIFKGTQYWRFEGDVLDENYPRNISVGFEKIPDNLDAAFAIPATSHIGKEKVYFFKGDQYYQYEFRHQPSHKECVEMTMKSPSALFTRYTDMYVGSWEDTFSLMFQGIQGQHTGPRDIKKDWIGIRPPVDAVMAGRLYVSPGRRHYGRRWQNGNWQWQDRDWQRWNQQRWGRQQQDQQGWGQRDWDQQRRRQQDWDKQGRRQDWDQQGFGQLGWQGDQGSREKQSSVERSVADDHKDQIKGKNVTKEQNHDYIRYISRTRRSSRGSRYNPLSRRGFQPVQNVYFFKGDQYYRVDLRRKTVDFAFPPYPRSIAKYWLGCPEKPGAEKK